MPGAGETRSAMRQRFQVSKNAVFVDLTQDDEEEEVKPSLQPQHVVKKSDSADEAKPSRRATHRKRHIVLDSESDHDSKPGQPAPSATRVKTEHKPDKKVSSRHPAPDKTRRIMRPDIVVPTITSPDQNPFKLIVKLADHVTVPNTSGADFDLERLCSVNMECVGENGRLALRCTQCSSMEFESIQWPADKPRVPAGGGHTFRSLHTWVYHELRPHHHFEFSIPRKIDMITHTLLNADGLLPVVVREWSDKYGAMSVAQVTNELRHIQVTKTITPRFKTWVDKASTQSRMDEAGHDEYPRIDYVGYMDYAYKKTG